MCNGRSVGIFAFRGLVAPILVPVQVLANKKVFLLIHETTAFRKYSIRLHKVRITSQLWSEFVADYIMVPNIPMIILIMETVLSAGLQTGGPPNGVC